MFRDVGGELDDFIGRAVGIEDRVIGGLKPDTLASFIQEAIDAGIELPAVELGPEALIFRTCDVVRVAEEAMVLSLDLLQAVAHELQEVPIGGKHGPVEGEFDGGQPALDGRERVHELRSTSLLGGDVATGAEQPVARNVLLREECPGDLGHDCLTRLFLARELVSPMTLLKQNREKLLIDSGRPFRRVQYCPRLSDQLSRLIPVYLGMGLIHVGIAALPVEQGGSIDSMIECKAELSLDELGLLLGSHTPFQQHLAQSEFQQTHDLTTQGRQRFPLICVELSGDSVNHAERTEGIAV